MNQVQVETLVNAGTVAHVHILRTPSGWAVYLYGPEGAEIALNMAVETARGGVRNWKSLDTVQRWLEALPFPRAPSVGVSW